MDFFSDEFVNLNWIEEAFDKLELMDNKLECPKKKEEKKDCICDNKKTGAKNELKRCVCGHPKKDSYSLIENGEYKLSLAIPGYDEKTVEVRVDPKNETITVSGKITDGFEGESVAFFTVSDFSKEFSLPMNIDYDTFTKSVKNGILVVKAKLLKDNKEEKKAFNI